MVYLYPHHEQVWVPSHFDTDKIEPHGYFREYLKIAADIGPWGKVCEVGVYKGESLKMWQALFPLGEVTGIDDYSKEAEAEADGSGIAWPEGTIKVVKGQDDPSLAELGPFDLIVDDASHDGKLTAETVSILWSRVKPGGYYVIEDWYTGLPYWRADYYDPELLATVASLLTLLPFRDAECESILFRYGIAIARKRSEPFRQHPGSEPVPEKKIAFSKTFGAVAPR